MHFRDTDPATLREITRVALAHERTHAARSRRGLRTCAVALAVCFAAAPAFAEERCEHYRKARQVGALQADELDELSGLTASRQAPGVFWTHNDSGDSHCLFAITSKGELIGTWKVPGADAEDWEDIAYGPCEDGELACIYIGDFGNNTHKRSILSVYRVREPLLAPGRTSGSTERAERFDFAYPKNLGRTPNAESIIVTPAGRIYILTKWSERTRLMAFPSPLHTETTAMLEEIASRDDFATATGADMAPDGSRFVVRARHKAWEFARRPGMSMRDAFLGAYRNIPLGAEEQGEAIAYSADGGALITTSEGRTPPIFRIECVPEASDRPPN